MAKKQPWRRPHGSMIPNRPGDSQIEPLFTALGRAVSAWEGVQAASASLFQALSPDDLTGTEAQAFGQTFQVNRRANSIKAVASGFFDRDFSPDFEAARRLRRRTKDLLTAYLGWAERRNDLAHGYVTSWQTPDHSREDQPLIEVFSLCPPHARVENWPMIEPVYNYRADEVEKMAIGFEQLDHDLEGLAGELRLFFRRIAVRSNGR